MQSQCRLMNTWYKLNMTFCKVRNVNIRQLNNLQSSLLKHSLVDCYPTERTLTAFRRALKPWSSSALTSAPLSTSTRITSCDKNDIIFLYVSHAHARQHHTSISELHSRKAAVPLYASHTPRCSTTGVQYYSETRQYAIKLKQFNQIQANSRIVEGCD